VRLLLGQCLVHSLLKQEVEALAFETAELVHRFGRDSGKGSLASVVGGRFGDAHLVGDCLVGHSQRAEFQGGGVEVRLFFSALEASHSLDTRV